MPKRSHSTLLGCAQVEARMGPGCVPVCPKSSPFLPPPLEFDKNAYVSKLLFPSDRCWTCSLCNLVQVSCQILHVGNRISLPVNSKIIMDLFLIFSHQG